MTQRIFHITLPKCGSQWVRDVLSAPSVWSGFNLQKVKGDLNSNVAKEMFDREGNFFSPVYNLTQQDWKLLRGKGDKAFVVLRDPRDRLISLLFSLLYSHEGDATINCWQEILLSQNSIKDNLKLLMLAESRAPFYLSWCSDLSADCKIIRYEDLVQAQSMAFAEIATWLGVDFSISSLNRAIDEHSFERKSGRSKGEEDKFSHYRSGVPGDWINYFDQSLGQLWETLHPTLIRQLGYEKNDEWWLSLPLCDDEVRPELTKHLHPGNFERCAALSARIKRLETENHEKHIVIEELSKACSERLEVINHIKEIADERLVLLEELHSTAEERLIQINNLNNEIKK